MGRGSYRGGSTIIRADPVMSLGGPTPSGKGKKEKRLHDIDLRVFSPAERARILEKVRESREAARKRTRLNTLAERKRKAAAFASIRKQAVAKAPERRVIEVPRHPERSAEPTGSRRQTRLSLSAGSSPEETKED